MAFNEEFGPVFDLAVWLETTPGFPLTLVHVGESADPTGGETTITLSPYGSDPREGRNWSNMRFQVRTRGPNAYAVALAAWRQLNGLSMDLAGEPIQIIALQSAPVYFGEEDNGGTQWVQNYRMEWEV